MLTVKTERAGDVVVVKCAGRIVRGQESTLRNCRRSLPACSCSISPTSKLSTPAASPC